MAVYYDSLLLAIVLSTAITAYCILSVCALYQKL